MSKFYIVEAKEGMGKGASKAARKAAPTLWVTGVAPVTWGDDPEQALRFASKEEAKEVASDFRGARVLTREEIEPDPWEGYVWWLRRRMKSSRGGEDNFYFNEDGSWADSYRARRFSSAEEAMALAAEHGWAGAVPVPILKGEGGIARGAPRGYAVFVGGRPLPPRSAGCLDFDYASLLPLAAETGGEIRPRGPETGPAVLGPTRAERATRLPSYGEMLQRAYEKDNERY